MNIQSRIKRIEKSANVSGFCLCCGVGLKYEVIPISIEEWKRRFDEGEECDERLPDFCDKCGKPIDKSQIEISFEEWQQIVVERLRQAAETMAKFVD